MAAKSKVDFFRVLRASPSISCDQGHLVLILVFWRQVVDLRGFESLLLRLVSELILQIHTV